MPTRTHRFLIMAAAGSLAVVTGLPALADSPRTGPSLLYDAGTGRVLFADDADQPWYPASLTKMMTAYLVFKAWKAGTVAPDAKIVISPRANSQPKMRLGLGAGKEITVNDAIEAIKEADYLTAEQKRDILYNNAARFLRLEGGRK